jgi:hypothetical protein
MVTKACPNVVNLCSKTFIYRPHLCLDLIDLLVNLIDLLVNLIDLLVNLIDLLVNLINLSFNFRNLSLDFVDFYINSFYPLFDLYYPYSLGSIIIV